MRPCVRACACKDANVVTKRGTSYAKCAGSLKRLIAGNYQVGIRLNADSVTVQRKVRFIYVFRPTPISLHLFLRTRCTALRSTDPFDLAAHVTLCTVHLPRAVNGSLCNLCSLCNTGGTESNIIIIKYFRCYIALPIYARCGCYLRNKPIHKSTYIRITLSVMPRG